jgi:DNA repair protein RecO (recombination protein O)
VPSRPHTLRVEAVVLRHSDWGEADRLLTIFSREQGKLRCVVKGARKLLSRKAGHLEPFTRVALLLARGADLWIVTQAETVDAYLPLRESLERTATAAYVVELLDRFTYEEGENFHLYQLLVDTLRRVSSEESDLFLSVRYYEVHLLDILGFKPELFHCVRCREEIKPQNQYFSFLLGGVLCPRDGPGAEDARPISMLALKYLRHLQRSTYAEAKKANPAPPIQSEMEAILGNYITFLLERTLNSPEFLHEIKRASNIKRV